MSHYKPYPAYRDSEVEWIGQVPEHWQAKPLKIAVSYNDDSVPETEAIGTPIQYVDISAVSHDEGIGSTEAMLFGDAPSRARRKAKTGDVIVSTVRTYLKAVAAVDDKHADCVFSTGFAVLRVREGQLNPGFLKWLALNELFIQAVESHSEGLSYPAINASELVNLKAAVPSLQEQTIIASVLDPETSRIDALITKKTRFIELLKEKRHALITHAVTKGLDTDVPMRETGVDWIGEVPEHWSVVQVRHVATLGSGHTPSRSRPDWWEECCIPWFTLADIWQVRREGRRFVTETEEKVSELGIANSSAVVHPAGSVILSRTASVGFPAIMGCDMATSQDFAVWRCGSRVVNEYLYLVLLGMKQELSRLMIGSTHKTIYMPDIEAFRMPLPPVEQQKEIIKYVGSELQRIDTVIAKTLRSIELLKERRAAFITAAVTGQIDLRESA